MPLALVFSGIIPQNFSGAIATKGQNHMGLLMVTKYKNKKGISKKKMENLSKAISPTSDGLSFKADDPKFDKLVYIRLFEGCNLNCEHCFIPNNPKKMDLEMFNNMNITQSLLSRTNTKEGSTLYIQWHGGEPTLLGVDYLRSAIEKIEADKRFSFIHGIQTNLINFDKKTDEWVDLYKRHFNGSIGVSWDYKIRHLKTGLIDGLDSNESFEEIFWKNFKVAQDKGLKLYVIITATKLLFEHFKNPMKLIDFLVSKGIEKVNFERITKTGYARDAWDKIGLNNKEYAQYMAKLAKAYFLFKKNNPETKLNFSPFDGLYDSVDRLLKDEAKQQGSGYGCLSGSCDDGFYTFDSNGFKVGCTAINSEADNSNKKLAKFSAQKIVFMRKEDILNERQKRKLTCDGCKYTNICSSGCLSVDKFDESLACSGGYELFKTIENIHHSFSHQSTAS